VISGAGPAVVVLTTHERAPGVLVPANRPGWQRLEPGIPAVGVEVVRV
jgi:homoserine kinase